MKEFNRTLYKTSAQTIGNEADKKSGPNSKFGLKG
jgi:hypothetical protein